jgi:HK97 gp10 family phage protein
MATSDPIWIDVSDIIGVNKKILDMSAKLTSQVDRILDANCIEIATKAKQLAPVDVGGLRASIAPDTTKFLRKHITVNAYYAAYVEFGTGRYAAQYIGTLPNNWKSFAAQFKSMKRGSGKDFFNNIFNWVKRNVTTTYSIKTQRRSKTKDQDKRAKQITFLIMRSIKKNGIRPRPFLFPAYESQRQQIVSDISAALKTL